MQDTSEDILSVLVAGDDAAQREVVCRALEQSGLELSWEEAPTVAQAWERLAGKSFDAVLVHFSRAGEDSARFLRDAKGRGVGTPLILLTDEALGAGPADWVQAGGADLIPKSRVSPESLARALQNVRRLHRAQMETREADTARQESETRRQESEARFRRVADSSIIGIVFWELDGTLSGGNDAFLAMVGYSREEMEQGALNWHTLTVPEYRQEDAAKIAELRDTGACTPWVREMVRRDGSRVALLTGASYVEPPDFKGLAFMVDVTELKRAQDAENFLADAGAALSASPQYAETLPEVARLAVPVFADYCLIDLVEDGVPCRMAFAHAPLAPEDSVRGIARRLPAQSDLPIGPAHVLRTGRAELVTDLKVQGAEPLSPPLLRSYVCAPLVARGRTLGVLTLAYTQSGRCHTPHDLALAEQLGQRIGLAVDNARFLFDTQARAEREAVVNAIGQTLRASLDVDTILAAATSALGKALPVSRCFWCWVPVAHGAVSVAPQQYAAPGIGARDLPPPLGAGAWVPPTQWKDAEPIVIPVPGEDAAGRAPAAGRAGPAVGLDSADAFVACPVLLRGDWSGLLVAERAGPARQWTASEVALVCQVGGLLGPALDNARLFEREHRVADMLQAAFLSNVPDRLGDLELATVYRAGLNESQVGGDCYDVFPLPDGRVALVIADVSGKGLSAAVVTATVKFSLRAFAAEVAAPGLALSRLNRMLCGEASGLGEHFVTLFYAVFDPAGGKLTYASAGHETQVIKRADGGSTRLGSTGPILGIADHHYQQQEERLGRADALVLFTDGLSEARNPQTRELLDIERICALLERLPSGAGAGALTARLEQLALDWAQGRPHDDMALLVARRVPLPEGSEAGDAWLEQEEREDGSRGAELECLFRLTFPSRAGHAADVRQAVAHWMETLGYDRPSRDDFLTAVTEAVTNAVLHGSPGGEADEFSVAAFRAAEEQLSVEVVDRGPGLSDWDTSPPMPGPEAVHGRGLPLMREFTANVEYVPTEGGLCVRLHTRRTPLSA